MKRLLCLLFVICCSRMLSSAQTPVSKKVTPIHAAKKVTPGLVKKKKQRRKKPIVVLPQAVVTFAETETSRYNIVKAARPAAETQIQTQEVQQNTEFFNSSKNNMQLMERYISPSELFRGNTESQPQIYISPSEILPSVRILNGPSQYDSRVEIRALDPTLNWVKKIIKNGYSVAVVVDRARLRKISKDFYQIDDSNTLGSTYQLCAGEAFRNQPVVGTGTAIVTGKRQMLTASHVFAGPISQYAVIFGYEINNKTGAYQTIFPADSVYFPVSTVKSSADLDIAVFNVDRDLNARPLKWSSETNPPINEPVYMIGFPYGLPKKVTANAEIITPNNDLTCFYTSLDAFQGNSGSPVFNLKTNEVIGILVSGNVDYHWNGSCNVSVACSALKQKKKKAVRITSIKNLLNYGN